MYKRSLVKPDERNLYLYSRQPIQADLTAPSPNEEAVSLVGAHMRWHPLLGEWVAYAGHRQNRTFMPPKEFNPLAPMQPGGYPTELPDGNYDVAVFDNMFPTLSLNAGLPPEIASVKTRSATGVCEVVVFTKDANSSLGRLPIDHIGLLLRVWGERYQELGSRQNIEYVMPFENRGVEVGVTLHHPHGQIYAYPFVPPVPAKQLAEQHRYFRQHGRWLLQDFGAAEEKDGRRVICLNEYSIAYVPACARYPYEVWVSTRRPCSSLSELSDAECHDLAHTLKVLLLKYDGLWQRPFPYLMVIHQSPTDGRPHPYAQLHFQFYPPYRSETRLKYLAGTEIGAGMFANDTWPEEKARELREVEVSIE